MRLRLGVACLYAGSALFLGTLPGLAQSPGALITQPIDERVRLPLAGNTRPEARNSQYDRGAVPDRMRLSHMLLELKRSPQSEAALEQLIVQLQDPRSPQFHHWLTAPELGHVFGPARRDIETIANWLKSYGFTVNSIHPSGMTIDYSGTAGQVRRAFGAPIHFLAVNGTKHIANIRDPEIPAALTPVVAGIVSLHDFRPHPMYRLRTTVRFGNGASQPIVPADLANIYNLKPLLRSRINGRGETIATIEDSDLISPAQWKKFRRTFGLPVHLFGSVIDSHPNAPASHGSCVDPGVNADAIEATIEAEWIGVAAPAATIEIASCKNSETTFGGLIALQNLVDGSSPPSVVGIGYGECESRLGSAGNAAIYATYQQAAAEGVSIFAAAGNDGAASCDAGEWAAYRGVSVNGYASTPYDIAVGGTDFDETSERKVAATWGLPDRRTQASALSYVREVAWNDSCGNGLGSSVLTGSPTVYGPGGFCDINPGSQFWRVVAGSGGPSGCSRGLADPNSPAAVSGSCAGYAKPVWQNGVSGNPKDGVRDIPDVSLFAGDGAWRHYYPLCYGASGATACKGAFGSWPGAGGTSFATAIMAGIQSLVDQSKGERQGSPAAALYAIAAKEFGTEGNSGCDSSLGEAISQACVIHDVTRGETDVDCTSARYLGLKFADDNGPVNCAMGGVFVGVLTQPGDAKKLAYETWPGWDFATGLGTVNAANLVKAWP